MVGASGGLPSLVTRSRQPWREMTTRGPACIDGGASVESGAPTTAGNVITGNVAFDYGGGSGECRQKFAARRGNGDYPLPPASAAVAGGD